ncbi:MAG: HigA family addiction module antitoxin [Chloroflexi bacterium]|nr:HigA family addiction module antitoxin [Chloroflexota bacterium]
MRLSTPAWPIIEKSQIIFSEWTVYRVYQTYDLVHGRRGVTPSTALRLSKYFGNTPGFWMNLQMRWDMYFAQQAEQKALEGIQPRPHPQAGD